LKELFKFSSRFNLKVLHVINVSIQTSNP